MVLLIASSVVRSSIFISTWYHTHMMASRYSVLCAALLVAGVHALGQNFNLTVNPNMTISSDDFSTYALIDEYNAGNWLSKFDVLQVCPYHLSL